MPTPISRLLAALAILTAVVMVPAAPAWAHNSLAEASPAKNAKLTKAPAEVRLRFLQRLDPAATEITVTDAVKKAVPASEPAVGGATGRVKFAGTLTNGTYTVAYDVASRDGHRVQGSYTFTVADPAAAVSPGPGAAGGRSPVEASAPALTEAADDEPTSGTGTTVAIVAGALALTAIAGGVVFRRRWRR